MYFKSALLDITRPPERNLPGLDLLRTIAICLVFLNHFSEEFPLPFPFPQLFSFGWIGVDLFFVLSGFLIGSQLFKEIRQTGTIRVRRFILRRGFRIWPLYFAFILYLLVRALVTGRSTAGLGNDALFISNFFHHQVAGGWSLSTEEQFYIAAPLLLLMAGRLGGVLQGVGLLLLIASRAFFIHHSSLTGEPLHQALYFPSYFHADGLACGMGLAWIKQNRPGWLRSQIAWKFTGLVAAGVILYAINSMLFNFTTLGLVFGSFALLFISEPFKEKQRSLSAFYTPSRLSYGVYLNHFYVLAYLGPILRRGHVNVVVAGVALIILSFIVALLTFVFVEYPFLRWRDKALTSERDGLKNLSSQKEFHFSAKAP